MLLELISPRRVIYEGRIQSVCLPTLTGDLDVKPGDLFCTRELRPGVITVVEDQGVEREFPTSGGMAEIDLDRVTILTR